MGLEFLLAVVAASCGAVSSIYMMIHGMERRIDARLDALQLAIAEKLSKIDQTEQRVSRLEDNQNEEAQNLRNVAVQLQRWVDMVAMPVNLRTDP